MPGSGRSSIVASFMAGLFFFFFFALGLFFEVVLIREFIRNTAQYTWEKVPCRIVSSTVNQKNTTESPFIFTVSYQYEYNSGTYTSSVYKSNYRSSEKYSQADRLVRKFPEGLQGFCYINKGNPNQAVLERGSLTIGLFGLIPLIFIFIGGGGLYVLITGKVRKKQKQPMAAKAKASKSRYAVGAVFLIFALAGAGMLYPLSILPIRRTIDARSWIETPCKVLDGRVLSHEGDESTTYSVYILYEYEFAGQLYKSDTYSFIIGSSSGHQGKSRVVESYKKAARPLCYVNPRKPYEAVLKRGFHPFLLFTLLPLLFLAIGLGGLFYIIRAKTSIRSAAGPKWLPSIAGPAGNYEQVVLKSSCTPFAKLLIGLAVCLFWNGIVSVLVISVIDDFRHHTPEWGKTLLSLPFVFVGLGIIIFVIYQFLAMFNPGPRLQLRPARVRLGGSAQIQWSFSGNVGRISKLTITLKGQEQATYRRGTKTHTDTRTFYEMELWKATDSIAISSGQTGFLMPEDTMHSFEAANNRIIWSIDVHGDIANWPDVNESFKIVIIPALTG